MNKEEWKLKLDTELEPLAGTLPVYRFLLGE